MATKERIEQLKIHVSRWEESLIRAEKRRDELIDHQKQGFMIFQDKNRDDLYPTLIQEADNAVKSYKNCLTHIQSVLDLALAGEEI